LIIGIGKSGAGARRVVAAAQCGDGLARSSQAAIGAVPASAPLLRLFNARRSLAVGILNGGDNLLNSGVVPRPPCIAGDVGWRTTIAGRTLYVLSRRIL
jgi:hypothetical protein